MSAVASVLFFVFLLVRFLSGGFFEQCSLWTCGWREFWTVFQTLTLTPVAVVDAVVHPAEIWIFKTHGDAKEEGWRKMKEALGEEI